ncbi:AAA family ATPase [Hyphomicrobium sp. D-2]|uniref:AAA family ATPase n=1 Tax=Hyphomicrobium sp. D-2 TaxID=3041621 RepID=UPI0024556701|nr:AAA family ATPase [Hyphomicrobium sp. D-2]MDH4982787.1 AAA family ATPase [Hyphomicrobium sp. D-2]
MIVSVLQTRRYGWNFLPFVGINPRSPFGGGAFLTEIMKTSTTTTNASTTSPTPSAPRIRPLGDVLDDETIKPRNRLLGPWLLERGATMVFAPPGVGKSWFSLAVATAVATCGTFGHWSAESPNRVLYIDGEMDMADLKGRAKLAIKAAEGGNPDLIRENVVLFARHDQPEEEDNFPDFSNPDDADAILAIVRQHRPQLVVLDNLSTLATVDDENAAAAWDNFLKLLLRIKSAGAAVLVVHHSNKNGEQYRGSSKIATTFEAIVRLRPNPREAASDGAAFLLDFTKTRMQSADSRKVFNVSFADARWHWDTLVDPAIAELVRRFLDGEFKSQAEAASVLGISKGEVSKRLGKAYAAGLTTKAEIQAAMAAAKRNAEDGEAH